MTTPGSLLKERYRLERLLGEGGTAQVWLALDERMGRQVAIKVLRPQYAKDEGLLERFRREARVVAHLDSPYLVQVYDVEVSEDVSFIVMEYVDGQDLKELLRFEGALPLKRALALLRDIAQGVAVAHEAGLIHRDLKPGNVLISRQGEVKVTDFGIARDMAGAGLTEPGKVWGTSHYIAPEQAMGRAISPATDIYSLGVLLFELLTGKLPFPGDDPVAVAIAHIQEAPPDIQSLEPSLPAGVARLVSRMMAKDPAQRPQNARALVEVLTRYLEDSGDATTVRPILEEDAAAPSPVKPRPRPVTPPPSNPLQRMGGAMIAVIALCLLVMVVGVMAAGGPRALFGEVAAGSTPNPVLIPTFTPPPGAATATASPTTLATETTVPLLSPTATPPPAPSPTSTALLTGPRQGNGPDALAKRLPPGAGITIDGNLSEWFSEQWRSQAVPLTVRIPEDEVRIIGESDLSGNAYFAWDERYLYLAVERRDDHFFFSEKYVGYELYRGDAVELWLDADLLGDFNVAEADDDDWQFAFSPGNFQQVRAEAVIYYPTRNEAWNRQVDVRAETNGREGYTLEARIPWSLVNVEPAENTLLGYVVVLNDRDPPELDDNTDPAQVASNGKPHWRQPLEFGNLILIP